LFIKKTTKEKKRKEREIKVFPKTNT